MDHDEKTLRLATEFCWRDSFLNLEGVIHGIKKKSQQVHIRAKFKAIIDHADKHLTMSMDHDAIGRVLLMGELEKLLAQSSSNIIEEYMDNEHDIRVAPHKTTFAEKIKQAIAAFFVAVILGIQHPWVAWSVVHHAFNSLEMDATMPQATSSSCLCSVISTNGRVLCGSYHGVGTRNSRIVKTWKHLQRITEVCLLTCVHVECKISIVQLSSNYRSESTTTMSTEVALTLDSVIRGSRHVSTLLERGMPRCQCTPVFKALAF